MIDLVKKNLMMGLGLASMTQEKVKELGKKLAEEGRLSQEEGERLIKELLDTADENRKNMENKIYDMISKAMQKVETPCAKRFDALEARLDILQKTVENLEKNSGDGR